MIIVILSVVLVILLYVLSTMCRVNHPGLSALRGWAYAHRGLHGDGVPENSMLAFRKALESGYGIELDVHLISDGSLAVIHDSSLLRTAGVDICVEDLTEDRLNDYCLEGTTEKIPLFNDVLNLYQGQAPLIVELKCVRNNYAALCRAVCDMLDRYSGAYCLESFDPRCIYWLRKNRPDLIRGQLTENYFKSKSVKIPWILKFLLRNQMLNFLLRPDFVAYRYSDRKCLSNFLTEKLWDAQSVTWTLKNQEEFDTAIKENRIPIFEGFCP